MIDMIRLFSDDAAAERWFYKQRWPEGLCCPRCGDTNVQEKTTHPTMPHRCRGCRKFFSVRTGTPMEASNLGFQAWALAIYLLTTYCAPEPVSAAAAAAASRSRARAPERMFVMP